MVRLALGFLLCRRTGKVGAIEVRKTTGKGLGFGALDGVFKAGGVGARCHLVLRLVRTSGRSVHAERGSAVSRPGQVRASWERQDVLEAR